MHYEANILELGQVIDVKIDDKELMHHFKIGPEGIEYRIARNLGYELIARPTAELQELQDGKILIKTATHYFELTRIYDPSEKWKAYKSLKK
jgi:hypothetical protein